MFFFLCCSSTSQAPARSPVLGDACPTVKVLPRTKASRAGDLVLLGCPLRVVSGLSVVEGENAISLLQRVFEEPIVEGL